MDHQISMDGCRGEVGDLISSALAIVGVTDDSVSRWFGRPCGCDQRRQRLNQLHRWATRVVSGKIERAREYLDSLVEEK